MFVWSGNKMLSIEFLMLLILLLVIKTINASTLPSLDVKTNKCEQISIAQHCPELKYNQTVMSNFAHGHHMDINDANEMVRGFFRFINSLVEWWAIVRLLEIPLRPTRHKGITRYVVIAIYLLIPARSTAATINPKQTKNSLMTAHGERKEKEKKNCNA